MIVVACDPGVDGALAIFHHGILDETFNMPTKQIILKEASYKYKYKDKSIVIKSGVKKGQRLKIIRKKAKTKKVIDFDKVVVILEGLSILDAEVVLVLETQFAIAHGKTIFQNYGELKGIGRVLCEKVFELTPQQWQRHHGITKANKDISIKIAERLFDGWVFRTHDLAESALIGQYYLDNITKTP